MANDSTLADATKSLNSDGSVIQNQHDEIAPSLLTRLLLKPLQQLRHGRLLLRDCHGWQCEFGDPSSALSAEIHVRDERFYKAVMRGGSIGGAEAYMDGWWDSPDLTAVVRVLAANMAALDAIESQASPLKRLFLKLLHKFNSNSVTGSQRNIAHHYDLSNAFYQLFLDDTMMYSSGVYPHQGASLQQASEHKLKLLCDDLQLTADDHLLEIGTGWGGLALFAAQHYGCQVTTTTISDAQYQFAKQRVEQSDVSDQITVLKQDYRQLEGQYSKIISIEMIEAVGYEHLSTFFKRCTSLLADSGKMVLQAITIADQREPSYRKNVDFIQRYIFPGGYLPSVAVLSDQAAKYSDMVIRQVRDIGIDYAQTLADWRENFEAKLDQVEQLGFDERFIRMWRFYLCYCEGGFRERSISTVQLTLDKPLR
ncbi:cyclopropane-fatty-acyl-phospholipid synthase family protein [Neiella marina]|uniref:Cyclopropane-fatty-acyl-phospholipid synthase family protein n=1 Tax=Neiella holothuriorum TaxID=2870530 RepID=A0ABS7EHU6_9GAMM|nr:cyclopropane-fatty-acyl-phospholipid synthase family protein [Neiella holothuriorum]MBW8191923.1 cyclopropane-fatty-acyl-phospholipid synthase family protein [Neiella holothuriorum]